MVRKVSRRLRDAQAKVENKAYEPLEALTLLKELATAKFDETAEAHIRLGIDPKYTDQQLRTTVSLPKGTGRTVRVAVIQRRGRYRWFGRINRRNRQGDDGFRGVNRHPRYDAESG